jgi:SAM-dependent methyltransferase
MDEEKKLQEEQYQYPYHYIPEREETGFTQTQHWSWGFRYLGGMKVVLDRLQNMSFESLIDIGCGDGRFLRELRGHYPETRLLGIDYSIQSIRLARAMNPNLDFEVRNILDNPKSKKFQIATLIEVLEHIPPENVEKFAQRVRSALVPEGHVILTVPHVNKSLNKKHYQHFDKSSLEGILHPFFSDLKFFPFDQRSRLLSAIQLLLGGSGDNFLITNSAINEAFFRLYINKVLYTENEETCGRIAVVGKRRS